MLAWIVLWPWISRVTQPATLIWRIAVVIAALVPLAFFLGMPFPLGLRAVGKIGDRPVAAAWAINGIMSVAGSILAVTVAILFGYSRVLLGAWGFYLLAGLIIWRLRIGGQTAT
jgi:hypothetical protein